MTQTMKKMPPLPSRIALLVPLFGAILATAVAAAPQ